MSPHNDMHMIALQDLRRVPWNIAARIYGNNHASLIGLLTHWWVSASPQTRWALESGPSFGYHARGVGGGMCDALLCENDQALGVLEVEGARGRYAAEKIGNFFGSDLEYYRCLSFGILVLYPYSPVGRGDDRHFPQPGEDAETIEAVTDVSRRHPQKVIAVVTLDKVYNRHQNGVRARNEYYAGELSQVTGFLYREGNETDRLILFDRL